VQLSSLGYAQCTNISFASWQAAMINEPASIRPMRICLVRMFRFRREKTNLITCGDQLWTSRRQRNNFPVVGRRSRNNFPDGYAVQTLTLQNAGNKDLRTW
jgi:hypothetical protein